MEIRIALGPLNLGNTDFKIKKESPHKPASTASARVPLFFDMSWLRAYSLNKTEIFFIILIVWTDVTTPKITVITIAEIAIIVVTIVTKAPAHSLIVLGCFTPK